MCKVDLSKLHLCKGGMKWYRDFKGSSIEAWNACPNASWMLWIAAKLEVNERRLCLAMGRVSNLVIHLMKDGRSRHAVKLSLDYGNGLIDRDALIAYASEAYKAMQEAYISPLDSSSAYSAASAAYYTIAMVRAWKIIYITATCAYNAASYMVKAAYDDCVWPHNIEAEKIIGNRAVTICREVLTDEIKLKIDEFQT